MVGSISLRDQSGKPDLFLGIMSLICLACGIVVGVAGFLDRDRSCSTEENQIVQWHQYTGGKFPHYWSYISIDSEKQHFCKVDSKSLYEMGIGYTTSKSYNGILILRP